MSEVKPDESQELALKVLEKAAQEGTLADSLKERLALLGEKMRNKINETLEKSKLITQFFSALEKHLLANPIEGVEFTQLKASLEAHPEAIKQLTQIDVIYPKNKNPYDGKIIIHKTHGKNLLIIGKDLGSPRGDHTPEYVPEDTILFEYPNT